MSSESELDKGQAGIFAALPDDPFGDNEEKTPTGTQETKDSAAEEEEVSDADAAAALKGDEDDSDDGDEDGSDADDEDGDEDGDEDDEDGDEDDDEDGDSEDGADEDDDEGKEAPDTFTVKVDGEDVEATLQELRESYSRTASWTRKSQKLADERKAFAEHSEAVKRMEQEYAGRLQNLETQMRADLPEEPSPADPQAWIAYQQKMQKLQAVAQERYALGQKLQTEAAAERQKLVETQNVILREKNPTWADPKVETAAKKSLATFAIGTLGFEETEIEQIVDHRIVKLFQMAQAMYELDEAKETVGKKKRKAKKTLKPGQSSSKRSAKGKKKARRSAGSRDALKSSGGMKEAETAIHDILGDLDI